ncbi:MAG: hypothetical protein PVI91_07850 [Gammaproteobacteria bacterium]|jgi:hypothetical protein
MTVSTLELANARETVRGLLEQLQLEAYLFEVEPGTTEWRIRVDCGVDGQWQSLVLDVAAEELSASRKDGPARAALLSAWGAQLHACTRGGNSSA